MMRTATGVLVAVLLVVAIAQQRAIAQALNPSEQRGLNFVQANCARCHSIDKVSPSPLGPAPPFRTLHLKYPVESLEEALAEGIETGHQNMPQFRLARDQIGDVIAYLKTLER
jgi:cytochrome c